MTWKRVKYERDKRLKEEAVLNGKPHNNRIFCIDCGRRKQLFETEEQAENFINYNADKLDFGGDTLRAYFCPACMGYHITHQPYIANRVCMTDRLLAMTQQERLQKKGKFTIAVIEAQRIWQQLPTEVQNLNKKKFATYCREEIGMETSGQVYNQLAQLRKAHLNQCA